MKHATRMSIVLTLIVLSVAANSTADMPFGFIQQLGTVGGPSSVDTADFNRDGHMDMAFTTIESDMVSIFFRGPSPWVLTLESDFDRACYVKAADINGDGWLDVVASNRGNGSLQVCWWQNPGNAGGTWSERTVAGGLDFSQSRAFDVGDLDADGDADLVVAGLASTLSYVSWFENTDGLGTAWTLRNVATGASFFYGPHDAVIADFNGDGRADVAAVAYDSDEVAWFENDGSIHDSDPWPKHTVETHFDGAVCVATADMDADGDPDIVAGAFLDGEIKWFENRVDQGMSWDSHGIEYSLDGVYTVQPVDMDFDGDIDVLAAARDVDSVVWYERIFSYSFVQRDITTGFDGARSAVAADFDGDGDLDVVAAGEFNNHIAWWENLSIHRTATFDSREVVESWGVLQPTSVDIADLDQDGDLDIVGTVFNETGDWDIYMWSRDGSSWDRTGVGAAYLDGAYAVRVADINADGIPDLVAAGTESDAVRWYRGDGSGVFTQITVATSIDGAKDVDTADFDCDGDLDIAAVAYQSGQVLWFENDDGAGTSWTTHLINTFDTPWSLRVADFDRDGNPDLVVADLTAGHVWALPHLGCGTAWGEIVVGTAFDGPSDVEVGDFNHDGWPDVVAAGYSEETITVWLNDSSDWTWDRHDIDTGFPVWGIGVGDLNRDGAADIVGFGQSSGGLRWWRNGGQGTSWLGQAPLDSDLYGTMGVAVGDIDADGLPDVVAAGSNDDAVTFYESRGGQYIVWTQDMAPENMGDSEAAAILKIIPVHGGISSDVDMELRNIGIRIDDGTGTPLTSAQANALILAVHVWFDADGNGALDPFVDDLLTIVDDLTLINGFDTIPVPHGGANPPIDQFAFYPFFLVVTTTADASSQTPNQFRISHRNTSPELGRYYDYPTMSLRPVWWDAFYATTVTCGGLTDLIFADGFETGSTGQWDSTTP